MSENLDPNEPGISFAEKRRRFRLAKGLDAVEPGTERPLKPVPDNPQAEVDPDLIPQVYDRSETDQDIDRVLGTVGILQAYNKWVNKEVDAATLARDEVMVSCPKPDHRDSHPSAWVNPSKGTWFCGGCQEGGDMYDIAALYEPTIDINTYKSGTEFHKLRERMFEAFGGHVDRKANFEEVVWAEPDSPAAKVLADADNVVESGHSSDLAAEGEKSSEQVVIESDVIEVEPEATITEIPVVHEDYDDSTPMIYPSMDWKTIVQPNTFLYEYIKACSIDDAPEEYHFWNGMIALGHAAGRRVVLKDNPSVFGNLLLVILGSTGMGKSKSRKHLTRIMSDVFPFQDHGSFTSGVLDPPIPGSGEAMVHLFTHIADDPNALSNPNPKAAPGPKIYTPVNGMVQFDEFSGVIKRVKRHGSTLESIIQAFADMNDSVKITSRTAGDTIAEKPFCSITSSSQPDALRGLITKDDAASGFLNRWLFVTGEAKERSWLNTTMVDLNRATDALKAVKNFCGIERQIKFSPEGLEVAVEFFRTKIEPAIQADKTALLKRMDLVMKKLMLLFAINAGETEISAETVRRTLPIFDYLVACYGMVHNEVGVTQNWEIGEKVFDACLRFEEKHKKGPTPRDIQRMLARNKYSPEQIVRTIETLVKGERIELIKPESKVGRPSTRYKVVS